ncbi:MAG: TolC family protein [Bdellovibrionaceae bacterium]|nr:TolC family protein [Bdellovibrionales bacterium]MCB9084943.1 TolC family protein [Pseudobdellovibrionaceae bacterium]
MKQLKWMIAVVGLTLLAVRSAWAQAPTLNLDEKKLVELAKQEAPIALQIEAGRLQVEGQLGQLEERYQTRFVGQGNYQNSKEKSIAVFIPTFGPTHLLSLGVEKASSYGTTVGVHAFTDQRSTADGSIDRATRTGLQVKATMDLWRDWLGKTGHTQLENLSLRNEIQKLDSVVQQKSFELNVRKLYWSLVANQEAWRISQGLLETSHRQLKDAKQRLRNSVGDAGEVARWEALVAARQGNLTSLEYQKEILYRQLKEQLPGLHQQVLGLAPYDLDKAVNGVLACTQSIAGKKETPWEATSLDEMVKLLEQEHLGQKRITATHSDVDVKLSAEVQVSGVDQGTSLSTEDLQDNGQAGYAVGLLVSVPLGGQSKKTEKILADLDRQRFLAEKQKLLGRINSQHEEIGPLIRLLQQSIASAQVNSTNLQKSLKVMNRKYLQARVPVTALINDEDAMFQSLLAEVNIKLSVVHTLLDYFQVFTDYPCEVNQL